MSSNTDTDSQGQNYQYDRQNEDTNYKSNDKPKHRVQL